MMIKTPNCVSVARCAVLLVCSLIPLFNALADRPLEIQEVFAHGVGNSPEGAAQNAAENALRQVVGAFISSEQSVDKLSQISDGIRSETRQISTRTEQYSQGSIKSFELLQTKHENGFYQADARVAVRIEAFKAYITKVAEAEAEMDIGEIAAMATDLKQQKSGNELLLEPLKQILSGQVVRLETGKPIRLSSYIEEVRSSGSEVEQVELARNVATLDVTTWIAIPITSSIDRDFLEHLSQKLSSIASKKKVLGTLRGDLRNEFTLQLGPIRGSGGATNPLYDWFTLPVSDVTHLKELAYTSIRVDIEGKNGTILESYSLPPFSEPISQFDWKSRGIVALSRDFYPRNSRIDDNGEKLTSRPYSQGLMHVFGETWGKGYGRVRILVDRRGVMIVKLRPEILDQIKRFNIKYDQETQREASATGMYPSYFGPLFFPASY